LLAAAGVSFACTAGASAAIVTFEGQVHGRILSNQFASQGLTSVAANNLHTSFDLAAIFDTTRTGTADPDLEDPWDGGNIAANTLLGNVVIIAENNIGAGDGVLDNPDDEGRRPAGSLAFQFAVALPFFGFDVVDIEGVIQEASNVQFFSGGSLVGTVNFASFVTNNNPYYDPTVVFGDNHANRIQPITAASLGVAGFDRVVINLGGSGAIDNLVIPSPSTAILAVGAGLFASRRRRA
jgi:hypothetical protein